MKKIIITALIMFVNIINAQYPILTTTNLSNNPTDDPNFLKNGNYAKDFNNERNQYVGLWRYQTADILFELKMEKRDEYLSNLSYQNYHYYFYRDIIIFKYKLVKNGVIIHDNLDAVIPASGYFSCATKQGDNNYLSGRMIDVTRNVNAVVSINRIPGTNPNKIFFDLSSGTYTLLNPPEYYISQPNIDLFNIPVDGIEMVRVY